MGPTRVAICRGPGSRDGARGQSLVEFALVVPLFLLLLMGTIEFGLVFNASLAIGYASRDAALVAVESGNAPGGDCLILKKIEEDVSPPADPARISLVEVYWSDQAGNQKGARNAYVRVGSMDCVGRDGSTYALPYTLTTGTYPETARCNVIAGCGGGHSTIDTVGVRVVYQHPWQTPMSGVLGWGAQRGWRLERANAMRMEPVL